MKKIFVLLLVVSVLVLSAVPAFAEETEESGFYDIGAHQDVEMKLYRQNTQLESTMKNLDSDETFEKWYENSDRIEISFTNATEGEYYGVILVKGSGLPTKDSDIIFIDQVTAESGTVDFNVYPMLPNKATPLSLYISSSDDDFELIKIPLNYYLPMPPYVIGDIDNDGLWNSTDALSALQIGAGLDDDATEAEKAAANVNGDEYINSTDALMILQFGAGLIDSWDE